MSWYTYWADRLKPEYELREASAPCYIISFRRAHSQRDGPNRFCPHQYRYKGACSLDAKNESTCICYILSLRAFSWRLVSAWPVNMVPSCL
jgi:hypothetical protein